MLFTAESMDSSAETKTALVRTPSPGTYIPGDEAEASGSTAAQSPRHTRFRGDTIAISDQPHISDEGRTSLGGTLRRKLTAMSTPDRKIKDAPNISQQIKSIIMASWLNVLLVFIPISWALNFALPEQDTLIFVFSFLAIIPLAKLLAFATDELSMRVGQTLAGLMNATLGNAVELIVAILALVKFVGSVLSNLLLVLGMCFFAGGTRFSEQGFGLSASQLNSSLLTISVIAVLLPAAFHLAVSSSDSSEGADILKVSHGVAIILLFIYCSYLVFQLVSHKDLYQDSHNDVAKSTTYHHRSWGKYRADKKADSEAKKNGTEHESKPPAEAEADAEAQTNTNAVKEEDEEEQPQLGIVVTVGLLVIVTVLVAVTAEWLVDSIDGLTQTGAISKEFVGIILLPIVGNAAEHVTAVTVSMKDKLTLSLGVAVGSSIQIALFVIPFIVTLGWILHKPLTLLFDPLESIVMFLAVLTVNYAVQDGKSNWLEGMILMCLYLILAVTFWFYPGSDPSGLLNQCT